MPDPFTTERLRLRAFEPEYLPALHAYLNYPELTERRYLPWRFPAEFPLSKAQVENLLKFLFEELGLRVVRLRTHSGSPRTVGLTKKGSLANSVSNRGNGGCVGRAPHAQHIPLHSQPHR